MVYYSFVSLIIDEFLYSFALHNMSKFLLLFFPLYYISNKECFANDPKTFHCQNFLNRTYLKIDIAFNKLILCLKILNF